MSLCKPYVYKLTHRLTREYYFGYREANKLPAKEDLPIYRSSSGKVRKLGFTNFDYEIVAELESGQDAYDLEQSLIQKFIKDNLCLNGHYTKNGKLRYRRVGPHTEETKRKQSDAKKGIVFSDEHRKKLSVAKIGSTQSTELIESRISKLRGRPLDESHRIKIATSLKEHKLSPETKSKISSSLKGRQLSEETKRKMSESHRLKHLNRIAQLDHVSL